MFQKQFGFLGRTRLKLNGPKEYQMKKLVIVSLISMVVGIASADPATRIAAASGVKGSMSNVINRLVAAGFSDDAVIAEVGEASQDAVPLLSWVARVDGGMSESFATKWLASVSDKPALAFHTAHLAPMPVRAQFLAGCLQAAKEFIPPKRASILVRLAISNESSSSVAYRVITVPPSALLQNATVSDLVALRLAPELRVFDEAPMILEKATAEAKKKLRSEGKSFVVKDGVNPLTPLLSPVVDALNAPLMVGLESALAGCGITIPNQNSARESMEAVSTGWKNVILDGDVAPEKQAPYLAALKVSLGVVEYNLMIKQYNGEN
jgi:hypothetical protein